MYMMKFWCRTLKPTKDFCQIPLLETFLFFFCCINKKGIFSLFKQNSSIEMYYVTRLTHIWNVNDYITTKRLGINTAVFDFTEIFLNAFNCLDTICHPSSTIDRKDNIYNFLSTVFKHDSQKQWNVYPLLLILYL